MAALTTGFASASLVRMKLLCSLFAGASMLLVASSAVIAADAPTEFAAGGLKFTRPAAWTWVPTTSAMRKAELKVEDKEKKGAAEVVFFHFGTGQGGDVKANVER